MPIQAFTKPQSMMDIPFCNFATWMLSHGDMFSSIGSGLSGRTIYLIGSGQANLYASVFLARAGAGVTILEARSHLAGRAECRTMSDGTKAAMGMMRYSRGQALWGEVLAALGYELKDDFPDPGVAQTLIAYKNERVDWCGVKIAPPGFERVQLMYHNFLINGWGGLMAWHTITSHLQAGNNVQPHIQAWISRFRGKTIDQALQTIFADGWNADDFERFDVLGVGSGGYGVYKHKSFLVIMRMIVNGFEDQQRGISVRTRNGYRSVSPQDAVQKLGEKVRSFGVEIKLGKTVTKVERHGNKVRVYVRGSNTPYTGDHVILGTTFPAAGQIRGLSQFIDEPITSTMSHERVHVASIRKREKR